MNLLTNGRVITRDESGKGYYEKGAVAFEGTKIVEVYVKGPGRLHRRQRCRHGCRRAACARGRGETCGGCAEKVRGIFGNVTRRSILYSFVFVISLKTALYFC